MTVREALAVADELRPNAVSEGLKLRWLSELEGRIFGEIFGKTPNTVCVLGEKLPQGLRLAAPPPYERLYWSYLVAMLDLVAADSAAYTASNALFQEAYSAFAKWYQRTKGGRM